MTIWTIREAGDNKSVGADGQVVFDPSFSPNWLLMPDDLGGQQHRVAGSCWMSCAPNPERDLNDQSTWWLEQKTRWHVLADSPMVVAEVVGKGWVVIEPGPEARSFLMRLAKLEKL
jgi:hypothetical protein